MGKGKGNLASKLAQQQYQDQQKRLKKQKLNNKEIHYPAYGKGKSKAKDIVQDRKQEDKKEEAPLDESKVFVPFGKNDRILIIGDGDFSYTLSIIRKKLINPRKVITTTYDSLEDLKTKYGDDLIAKNINELKELGVSRIYHNIDGTRLPESLGVQMKNKRKGDGSGKSIEVLGGLTINNIVFNFPHIGKQIKDVNRNILKNQEMLTGFFKSSGELFGILRRQKQSCKGATEEKIPDDGEEWCTTEDRDGESTMYFSDFGATDNRKTNSENITITLFDGEPYESWKVKRLARDSINYCVERSGKFEWRYFEGYKHRRTAGLGETNKASTTRHARIYKFEKFSDSSRHLSRNKSKKRGRGADTESDDEND